MKKNMGTTDKAIRIGIALIIIILFSLNFISGTIGYIALAFAIVFAFTSFISYCPLYAIFGINTCAKKS